MKKIFTASVATAMITVMAICQSIGQEIALNNKKTPEPQDAISPKPTSFGEAAAPVLHVSVKALKDFKKSYRKDISPKWEYTPEGGFTACFAEGDVKNYVFYSQKGNWMYTIKRYSGQQLDQEIIRSVMPSYYGYKINGVAEISMSGSTIYLLYLQDAANFKTVRIAEEQVDVVEWIKDGRIMSL